MRRIAVETIVSWVLTSMLVVVAPVAGITLAWSPPGMVDRVTRLLLLFAAATLVFLAGLLLGARLTAHRPGRFLSDEELTEAIAVPERDLVEEELQQIIFEESFRSG